MVLAGQVALEVLAELVEWVEQVELNQRMECQHNQPVEETALQVEELQLLNCPRLQIILVQTVPVQIHLHHPVTGVVVDIAAVEEAEEVVDLAEAEEEVAVAAEEDNELNATIHNAKRGCAIHICAASFYF